MYIDTLGLFGTIKTWQSVKTQCCTHVKEVSCHAAAMALLVPVCLLAAGAVQVTRKATVVAVLVGTFTDQVTWGATKEARRQLLHTHRHITVSS